MAERSKTKELLELAAAILGFLTALIALATNPYVTSKLAGEPIVVISKKQYEALTNVEQLSPTEKMVTDMLQEESGNFNPKHREQAIQMMDQDKKFNQDLKCKLAAWVYARPNNTGPTYEITKRIVESECTNPVSQ